MSKISNGEYYIGAQANPDAYKVAGPANKTVEEILSLELTEAEIEKLAATSTDLENSTDTLIAGC